MLYEFYFFVVVELVYVLCYVCGYHFVSSFFFCSPIFCSRFSFGGVSVGVGVLFARR